MSYDTEVGGLVGADGLIQDTSNFWDVEVSGLIDSAGGTGKMTSEMKNVRTYTDVGWSEGLTEPWDFVGNPYDDANNEDIWNINPGLNNGYPFLTWQKVPNTLIGENVNVVVSENVTITFENVTVAGDTTATIVSGSPPANFELVPDNTYYDITTTAAYTGKITLAINYGASQQENDLKLKVLENGSWVNITTRVDTENNIIYGETTHLSLFAVMFELPKRIEAVVDIKPDTLNLKSNGKWITAYIELPIGQDVSDIDVSTVLLEGVVPAELHPTSIGDHDVDGVPDLMVKFDRSAVQSLLSPGTVTLKVTGRVGALDFEGSDEISVIAPGKGPK
ncbi:MAG: hypothetical protein AB1305_00770 [Candidatus Hadarchaeota archaeon]